jgi:hypothetical protein
MSCNIDADMHNIKCACKKKKQNIIKNMHEMKTTLKMESSFVEKKNIVE